MSQQHKGRRAARGIAVLGNIHVLIAWLVLLCSSSAARADSFTLYVEPVFMWGGHTGRFGSPQDAFSDMDAWMRETQGGNYLINLRPSRSWSGPRGQWAYNQFFMPHMADAVYGSGPLAGQVYGQVSFPMSPQCPDGSLEQKYVDHDLTRFWLLCAVSAEEDQSPPEETCPAQGRVFAPQIGNPILPLQGVKREVEFDSGVLAGGYAVTRHYSSDQLHAQQLPHAGTVVRKLSAASPFSDPSPFLPSGAWCVTVPYDTGGGIKRTSCHPVVAFESAKNGNVLVKRAGAGARVLNLPSSGAPVADLGRELWMTSGGAGYWVLNSDNTLERYSSSGLLLVKTDQSGKSTTLAYDSLPSGLPSQPFPGGTSQARLVKAEDLFGRGYSFQYGFYGPPNVVLDPAGAAITYSYDAAAVTCLPGNCGVFKAVQYPDGARREYLFNEADLAPLFAGRQFLTGLIDELGARYATFAYGTDGRAVSTEHAGGVGRNTVAYSDATKQRTVTDPLGSMRALRYGTVAGYLALTGADQPGGSGCAASSSAITYDANGNVASRDDFNGVRSCYAHSLSRNLERSRVEGLSSSASCGSYTAEGSSLPAGARKVSTAWHPDWRLSSKVAEPGRLTTKIYNGQPDPFAGGAVASCAPADALLPDGKPIVVLCKQVEQATTDANGSQGFNASLQSGVESRTTSWTYNRWGQVLSEDGPRTDIADVTSYSYYADTTAEHTLGDLQSVTNAAGQVSTYTKYNKHGQVLEESDANGVVTTRTYDLRQRLTSVTVAGQTTTYTYDPAGQLTRVTAPDQSHVAYEYDPAHRLVAVADSEGNRIEYTLDNAGNRTAEQVKDPNGALSRQLSRVFDALGRMQQSTGRSE